MEKHITLVALINIILGALGLFAGIIIFIILFGAGIISGDPEALTITSLIGFVLSVFFLIVSIPGIIGGIGLLKHHNWARILILIISFLNLLSFPIGTIAGAYGIWVLVQDETVKMFDDLQQAKTV